MAKPLISTDFLDLVSSNSAKYEPTIGEQAMKPALDAMEIHPDPEDANAGKKYPELYPGPYIGRRLGDHFDLTRFGVNMEILPPGSKTALRHWHSMSDEFVMVLEGTMTLVTNDGEAVLGAGMVVGFKAGEENGHHLVNRSDTEAKILVVGARIKGDAVTYPDDDLQWMVDEDGSRYAARKDGTRY
jgi:uncharacterized cupin superfamily protein